MPRTPLEAYVLDARFGKRSVFILDPRLTFYLVISDLWCFIFFFYQDNTSYHI